MRARAAMALVALLAGARGAGAQPAAGAAQAPAAAQAKADAEEARVVTHRVERGDTLELLAAEYYGDRRHKIYIMIENRLNHARPLKPGERMRIPVSNEVVVTMGDTLASLAAQHMGDERRAKYLAEFNRIPADSSVAVGTTITIPLRVTYRAARREPLSAIAAGLFADTSRAQLLKEYNFLRRDVLERGEGIVVPIYLRVHPSKREPADAASSNLVRLRAEAQENARRALEKARRAWDKGDYEAVKGLADLATSFPYLDADLVAHIGVLLGGAYVAFDDPATARTYFRLVLKRAPGYALSAFDYSPKVCEVWRKAGGRVNTSPPP